MIFEMSLGAYFVNRRCRDDSIRAALITPDASAKRDDVSCRESALHSIDFVSIIGRDNSSPKLTNSIQPKRMADRSCRYSITEIC